MPKTCSQINILIFSLPQTPKTASTVVYFCCYKLSNDEDQKSNLSSQKRCNIPQKKPSTPLKMEEFKKCQCGPISPSPGQNIRLRHIQISVGFLITLAIRAQLSVKVLRILAWFLDKLTHFREESY